MEFLMSLEKAKALGLTKEEFMPIYMQEVQEKIAVLLNQSSKPDLFLQSNAAMNTAASNTSSEPQSVQQRKELKLQQQLVHTEPHQLTETYTYDLKPFLDNMKDIICSHLLNFKFEMAVDNNSFAAVQQEVENFIRKIDNDIQILISRKQNDISKKQFNDNNEKFEILHAKLLEKIVDQEQKLKKEIQHAQEEIISEFQCQNCKTEIANLSQTRRQEELFMLQGSLIQDCHNKSQLNLQQRYNESSVKLDHFSTLLLGTFNKICEFQNIVCSEMHQQKQSQQMLNLNSTQICSSLNKNNNFLAVQHGLLVDMGNQNQQQHLEVLDSLNKLQNKQYGSPNEEPLDYDEDQDNADFYVSSFQEDTCSNESNDDSEHLSENHMESLHQDLDRSYENDMDLHCGIISLTYDFYVRNILSFFKSEEGYERVVYDKKLGCCLRASIYYSGVTKPEDVLEIRLDMCQIGQDVKLPDLLRISTEISLVDTTNVLYKWIVARENGIFDLPRLKDKGWFEVCVAFLDFNSPEFVKYIQNGDLSLNYTLQVFNRKISNIQKANCDLSLELNNDTACSSDDENTLYFDTIFEEIESTENLKLSEISPASSETATKNSILKPLSLECEDGYIIASPPHSSYFFPICDFSLLIGSETLIDSPDWYLQFLGHSIHAVLAFLDDDTMMICIDCFHGNCFENLPEFALFRCRVTIMDQTDAMEDLMLGERTEIFDLTRETCPDWMDGCVCMVNCSKIKDRFMDRDTIVLKFDIFEMEYEEDRDI